jgi:hypothetical protein
MVERNINENFKVVVSTKKTLFGASASDFDVYYAPVDDLTDKTVVSGGLTEAVIQIASGDEHTATTTASSAYGSRLLYIDDANSTLEEGDTIEYASGKYAYIRRIVGNKVYLKTPIRANVASGTTLTQVGNTGEYTTQVISIPATGEYIVAVEGSDYGILVEQRVKVVDPDAGTSIDPDAPDDTVAVAY